MPTRQILIVDDQRSVRKFIISLLTETECEFLEAENGQVAINTLERNGPVDLIISDVDMPLLDGLTLCQTLKGSERFRAMPVVIVSSFDSEFDVERGFQAGAHSYIPKSEVQAKLPTVADTYDAMISNRPYRDGFVTEHTLKTIRNIRGSQLCPECVDLFCHWIDQCSRPLTPPRELPE